jgi:mycothiol synthase
MHAFRDNPPVVIKQEHPMSTLALFQARPYASVEDLPAICELINTCNAVDELGDEPYADLDGMRQWLDSPGTDPARDIRLWWDTEGRLAGFARVRIADPDEEPVVDANLYMRVHPDSRSAGLEPTIVEWATARARQTSQERRQPAYLQAGLHLTTPAYIAYRQGMLEALGFRPVRYQYKMARPLDQPLPEPVFPVGYSLRRVDRAADRQPWVDAFNGSFIDHWNFHPMSLEQYDHSVSGPDYAPDGDLIAVAPDGSIAAFCRCEIRAEDNAATQRNEGWIDVLGTRRGHRQIGLGRAILLAGMGWLKSQGIATAVLGVDAENPTGALRLYQSVGFEPANRTAIYQKDL